MKRIMRRTEKVVLTVICILLSNSVVAQTLSSAKSQLDGQQSDLIDLLDSVLTFLAIGAFVFMVSNIVFNYTDQKKSYVTFFVVLVLKGMFTVLF